MLHYSKRLIPVPPTYERVGAGLGRPFSDLIFAKWVFNNVQKPVPLAPPRAASPRRATPDVDTTITGLGSPPYDTWRCHMTVVSYDGPEVSYDGGVI